jgi:hypothetical protein
VEAIGRKEDRDKDRPRHGGSVQVVRERALRLDNVFEMCIARGSLAADQSRR